MALPPKLTRRHLHRVYRRPRLLQRLEQALANGVCWICGPPGSGKTTLASTCITTARRPCIWYQIDERDCDPATLFHYLRRAALHVAPQQAAQLPYLTPEHLPGLNAFALRFFERFFALLEPGTIVVFDNCQVLPEASATQALLAAGVGQAPESIGVILASRLPPYGAFARMQFNESLAVIDGSELALDMDEAKAIAAQRFGSQLPQSSIEQLHRYTLGWVAGFTLLIEQTLKQGLAPAAMPPTATDQLVSYFTAEVLSGIDPQTLETLLQSAWLPYMPTHLLTRQCEDPQAATRIAELCRRNYFTSRSSGPQPTYEYHPLFRDCLLQRAREQWPTARFDAVRRRAAQLLVANGQTEDALELLIKLGDWEQAAELLQMLAQLYIEQGRLSLLESSLRALPEAEISARPCLLYWQASCRLPFDPVAARVLYSAALDGFEASNDARGSFLAWAGVVDSFVYEWGDFTTLDRWIERFEALRRRYPVFPDAEAEAQAVTGIFTALIYRQPQHPELPQWSERTYQLIEQIDDQRLRVLIGSRLVAYHAWWSGDLARAASLTKMLQPQIEHSHIDALTEITWCAIHAIELWMRSQTAECVAMAQHGLEIAEREGVPVWDFMLLSQAAWGRITTGKLEAARDLLQRMGAALDPGRLLDACHYHYVAFILAMHDNDGTAMFEEAGTALRLARQAGSPWAQGIVLPALARALALRGEHRAADAAIDEAAALAQSCRSGTIAYAALLARTELARSRGQTPEMLAALNEFLTLCRQHDFTNSSWWRSDVMADLCVVALEQRIEVEFVQRLIRTRRLAPERPPLHLPDWPWAVQIHALGHFEVLLNGTPLRFEGKSQKQPLALLKVLVAMGGKEIPEARVADALWPDAEGDAARQALATTLHRLRRLIGAEAIRRQGGRLGLEPSLCWVDLWACEQRLAGLEEVTDPQATSRELQAILAINHGPFLEDDPDAPWALSVRERMRDRLSHCLIDCGDALRRSADLPTAINCYQRALALDELAEAAYRGLMRCHLDSGCHTEGLAVYRRCAERLRRILGVTPSPATEALHRQLTAR